MRSTLSIFGHFIAFLIESILATSVASAQTRAQDFAVFGGQLTTFRSFVTATGAPVGSNGNVVHDAGIGTFESIFGAGALNPNPPSLWNSGQHVLHDVIFNGKVTINSISSIEGSLHSGGSVAIGAAGEVGGDIVAKGPVNLAHSNEIGGNVIAGGAVTIESGVNLAGNVGANGAVSLGINSHVAGTVTHNGNLTIDVFSSVGGSKVGTVSPQPQSFTPASLPASTTFTAGGSNVELARFQSRTLAPGSYGALTFNGSDDLTLSAGDYFFTSISSPGLFNDIHLNLGSGQIRIFVTGDVQFDSLDVDVNGVAFENANPLLASRVYLESHGSIHHDGSFFGTLHAPIGNVETDSGSEVIGSIIAGMHADIGSNAHIIYAGSAYLGVVPEPQSLGIILCAAIAMLRRRQ